MSGQVLYDVVNSSSAGCRITESALGNIIDRQFVGTGSTITTMHKDLTIAMDLARQLGVPMFTAAIAMQLFEAGKTKYPEADNWVVTRITRGDYRRGTEALGRAGRRGLFGVKKLYSWAGSEVSYRNLTVADIRAAKGTRKLTQVTANTADEAAAAEAAGIDMIIGNSANIEAVRKGSDTLFLTAAIALPNFTSADDVLREAFRVMALGADSVMTQRSLDIVSMLAREDIPVMGHLGLVPRKSTWVGGLRAVGRNGPMKRSSCFKSFKRLEEAGAFSVEAEIIPAAVMVEISTRTGLITVSLGSGGGADVNYLFMNDICGESEERPRHARAFGNLHRLYEQIRQGAD